MSKKFYIFTFILILVFNVLSSIMSAETGDTDFGEVPVEVIMTFDDEKDIHAFAGDRDYIFTDDDLYTYVVENELTEFDAHLYRKSGVYILKNYEKINNADN